MGRSTPVVVFYELKPFICTALGLYASAALSTDFFGKMAGFLLVLSGTLIFYMRARHRGVFH